MENTHIHNVEQHKILGFWASKALPFFNNQQLANKLDSNVVSMAEDFPAQI